MKTYTLTCDNGDTSVDIIVNDGDMIVYDVCKVKDYEGGDYVPRNAREMDYAVLQTIGNHDETPG